MNKKIFKITICIALLILIAMVAWVLFDKSNMYHVDINNPNLIKTEKGYKEELVIEETIITNKYIQKVKLRLRAPNIRKSYNIQYYNEELKETVTVSVDKVQYNELNVGDKIKTTRVVTYNKSGLRLNYKDTVEKIEN